MTILPVEVELFHANRETVMNDLLFTFCNFANIPNNMTIMFAISLFLHSHPTFCIAKHSSFRIIQLVDFDHKNNKIINKTQRFGYIFVKYFLIFLKQAFLPYRIYVAWTLSLIRIEKVTVIYNKLII